ncbi:MAG: hypothetical protein ABI652_00335 [Acidobacteriota bacterium]
MTSMDDSGGGNRVGWAFGAWLFVIVSGAWLTSGREAATTAGYGTPVFYAHLVLGAAATVVGLSVAGLWLMKIEASGVRRVAAGIGVLVIVCAALGWVASSEPRPSIAALHAWVAILTLAAVLFGRQSLSSHTTLADEAIVRTSDAARLRLLASASPFLMALQVAFGASYRHQLLSIMPHMAGAGIASVLMLVVGTLLLQKHPEHRALRVAASLAIAVVLVQVALGVGAFVMQLLDFTHSRVWIPLTVLHVTVGALALAVSVNLAWQVRRYVRPLTS